MTRPPTCQRPGARRVRRAGTAVGLALVSMAVVVGVVPLPTSVSDSMPVGVLAAPVACAAPATDGTISVAVAVDPGGVAAMAGGPETMCVRVPAGATGADVLAARARALGRPVPRYNSAGLLCAIDGQPATGCGERVDGAYRYWAYFLGTGGWTYAGTGPALRRANAGTTEGWRFVAGAGNATDPPPRTSASPTAICPPLPTPPPTTAAPAVPTPTPTNPGLVPGGGGAAGMGGQGSRGSATVGEAGASTGGTGTGEGSSASGGSDASAGSVGGAGEGTVTGEDGSGRVSATGEAGSGGDGERSGDEVAGVPVVETSSSGGPPAGALVVAALVVALAAGAVVQVRRRGAS